jgi:hypothetical protein
MEMMHSTTSNVVVVTKDLFYDIAFGPLAKSGRVSPDARNGRLSKWY